MTAFKRFELMYNTNQNVSGMAYVIYASPAEHSDHVVTIELHTMGKVGYDVVPGPPEKIWIEKLPKKHLNWSETVGATGYRYAYRSVATVGTSAWVVTGTTDTFASLHHLNSGSKYEFKTQCLYSTVASEFSDVLKVRLFPLDKILKRAKCLKTLGPSTRSIRIYEPNIKVVYKDDLTLIRCIHVGKPVGGGINLKNHTVLVMGASGSGKSAWINNVVNHFYEVDYSDMVRLKLINDEGHEGDGRKSTTKWITSYVLHRTYKGINESLTLIDTPGFGDTDGVRRDQEITEQLAHFFLNPDMQKYLQSLTAIGIIVPGSQCRLGVTQHYVINKVLQLFGSDLAENLFWLVTFSDDERPAAVDSILTDSLPSKKYFVFNNAHLFSVPALGGGVTMSAEFWQLNYHGMVDFFEALQSVEPKSLVSTRNVILEREMLTATLEGLAQQITCALDRTIEHRSLLGNLRKPATHPTNEETAQFEATVFLTRLVDLPDAKRGLICMGCQVNCHAPCTDLAVRLLWSEWFCSVVRWDGSCSVCPKRCPWRSHNLDSKAFERVATTVRRTIPELLEQYDISMTVDTEDPMTALMRNVAETAVDSRRQITALINRAQNCQKRLEEIALKPCVTSLIYFLDELIADQQRRQLLYYKERIQILEEIKVIANEVAEIKEQTWHEQPEMSFPSASYVLPSKDSTFACRPDAGLSHESATTSPVEPASIPFVPLASAPRYMPVVRVHCENRSGSRSPSEDGQRWVGMQTLEPVDPIAVKALNAAKHRPKELPFNKYRPSSRL
ncbi:hypothetical protein BV898_00279 [Hypsibius exemplaris]|uniref:Fibronectin type-III domain-containing protein n=1 Tax=Hypsibius exemplaris TaxID=2072580 RepID=A0A1W0XFA8_HYPEX|nr:hypothetical protein BV898_00279 [Hypsibius exemplaris]